MLTNFSFSLFFLSELFILNNNYNSIIDISAKIHLLSTYAFLDDEEGKVFAANEQNYLIEDSLSCKQYLQ